MTSTIKIYKGYRIDFAKEEPDYKMGIPVGYFISSIQNIETGKYLDFNEDFLQDEHNRISDAFESAKQAIDEYLKKPRIEKLYEKYVVRGK